jgi:hypothetical protein
MAHPKFATIFILILFFFSIPYLERKERVAREIINCRDTDGKKWSNLVLMGSNRRWDFNGGGFLKALIR